MQGRKRGIKHSTSLQAEKEIDSGYIHGYMRIFAVGVSEFQFAERGGRRHWHQKQRCVIELHRKVQVSQKNVTVVLLVMTYIPAKL